MARNDFKLEYEQTEKLISAMEEFGTGSGKVIDEVLHNEGGKYISDEIKGLLPESGRKWKGKKTAARRTQPFRQENNSLSVAVVSKTAYNYLYFPDDGTNTKRHRGQQYFMWRGAQNQTDRIIDLCVSRLIEKIGE